MMQPDTTATDFGSATVGIRVAVYGTEGNPEITEISASSPGKAGPKFSRLVADAVEDSGGSVPAEAIREVVENLVHADYQGVVVSVLDGGNTLRVSDRGPGIPHKNRAMEFGFSGATADASRIIRGVGAGLGMARAAAEKVGGTVVVEDNIGGGTVVTVAIPVGGLARRKESAPKDVAPARRYPDGVPRMNISERQQKVLVTVLESGEVGPSTVAGGLEISVSTAYRDLSVLEEHGLLMCEESGKRRISPLGRDLVASIISTWVK
ncbi:MAG: ATP-binding protein [Actinomycetota bacterium]|nr:ATP-binding protein [Actinomycetota bacterium]